MSKHHVVHHIEGMEATLDICSYLTNTWNLVLIYQLPLSPGKEILIPYMKYHAQSLLEIALSPDTRSQFGTILTNLC
jgi:hypothetical protein